MYITDSLSTSMYYYSRCRASYEYSPPCIHIHMSTIIYKINYTYPLICIKWNINVHVCTIILDFRHPMGLRPPVFIYIHMSTLMYKIHHSFTHFHNHSRYYRSPRSYLPFRYRSIYVKEPCNW